MRHRTVLHPAPIHAATLAKLRAVSDAWLSMVRTTEKRFSLGWFSDAYVAECPVTAVEQPDGRIVAFANIIPEYTRNEATIDLMRRRPDAESGTMDLLFVALLEWAKAQGFATFNLGLSPLAGVGGAARGSRAGAHPAFRLQPP